MAGLTIRHFERREADLPVELRIADACAEQVRFAATSAAAGKGLIRARTLDISSGGLGLTTKQYLPRQCRGVLRIFRSDTEAQSADSQRKPIFEHPVKVRRVSMTSHDPQYFVGLAFEDVNSQLEERILALLRELPPSQGAGEGADRA